MLKNYHWTKQEKEILKEHYPNKHLKDIVKEFFPHRTLEAVHRKVGRMGLLKRQYGYINPIFFEIPNVLNNFIAGFFSADGCISTQDRFIIRISRKDYNFLVTIKEIIGFTGNIHTYSRLCKYPIKPKPNDKIYYKETKMCSLCASNAKKWNDDLLRNWNITPRKTYTLEPPYKITELDQILAFMVGSINGDGCITFGKNSRTKLGKNLHINFLGTYKLCSWFKEQIDKLFPYPTDSKTKVYPHETIFAYPVYGVKAYILSKMFLSLGLPRLERKWSVAEEYINMFENQELSREFKCKIGRMLTPDKIQFIESRGGYIPKYIKEIAENKKTEGITFGL